MSIPTWVALLRSRIGHDPLMAIAVNAVVMNEEGSVLLQKRADNGAWGLPGGIVEMEESVLEAVVRETKEETGLTVSIERLTGVYSAQPVTAYPNGDQVCFVTLVFACQYEDGVLGGIDDESTEAAFFPLAHLPPNTPQKFLQRIHDAVSGPERIVIV